jgi:PAS domain S-box-containing protein
MSIRARIILAALAVVAAVTFASVAYTVDRERKSAVARLLDGIGADIRLLQVVTAGPLYDGNVAQLNAILDSLFANPDVLRIALVETRGDIALARNRDPAGELGERIERRVRVLRGSDELGTVGVAYTTANIEQRLAESRDTVVLFSLLLMGLLSLVIYVLAARLTRPIERLTRAAREIAAGDLNRDIEARGAQELAILGQSFIQMRDAVREKIADLAANNLRLTQEMAQRLQAEQERDRLASIMEATSDLVAISHPDGSILYLNHAGRAMLGMPLRDPLTSLIPEVHPRWAADVVFKEGIPAAIKDGAWSGETAVLGPGGREVPVSQVILSHRDEQGNLLYLSTIMRDMTERRRVEEALRESEERLSIIFYRTPLALAVTRFSDAKFLDVNDAWLNLLGYTRAGLLGRTSLEIGLYDDPRDRPRLFAQLGTNLSLANFMVWFRRSDRTRMLCDLSLNVIDIRGEHCLIWSVTDITERERAAQALRISDERLRQAVRVSAIGIFDHDQIANTMYWSPEQRTIYGLGRDEEVTLRVFLDHVFPEDLERIGKALTHAHTPGGDGRFDVEHRIVRSDGAVRWITTRAQTFFDGEGGSRRPVRTVGAVVDVTERSQAEQALRESEAKISEAYSTLDDAIESAPAAVAVYDAEDKLIAFNSRFKAFFAFNPALVRPGMDFATLVRRFTESGQVAQPRRHDEHWLEARVRTHRDPSGPIELDLTDGRWLQITETRTRSGGVVTVYNDITELKERETELRRLNEELERKVAERTADLAAANKELEAFVYSVSHDLRAPLRGIDGFSHVILAQHGEQLDQEARQMLERVRAAAQRMGRLIADLLELSRLVRTVVRSTDVDLSRLAREVIDELSGEAGGRAVEWHVQPDMRVRGDPGLLRVALANLLGNALKYSRDASPARIELGIARRHEHCTEFFVRDNGAGFDMNYAARLFQPFQRLHAQHEFEGTGIGLATVLRVIAKHGGEIRGEGRPGAGATFYFTLPD